MQNPSFTFDDDGIYTVTLTVTDDDGTMDSQSYDVTIGDLGPTADFTWSPEPQTEGSAVAFTDASVSYPDAIVAWSWDFGGQGTSTLEDPSFTFMDDGLYTVALTVTDDDGTTGTISHDVTIVDLGPTAAFTWAPEPQDEGSTVVFTDASASPSDDIVAWSWDFGGTGTSTEANPSFTFMDDGTYTVTLTVTDDDGTTGTISHDVTIVDLDPTAAFTWVPEPQDEGMAIQFTDLSTSPSDDIVAWSWDFAGRDSSSQQNPQFTFTDDGSYTVTLTVTDDDGSTDSVFHTVTVVDLAPTAAFTWSPEPQAEGSLVSFSDASSSLPDAIAAWSWDFAGLGTSAAQNPTFTFVDDGSYDVALTVTDDDGTTDSQNYDVTIGDLGPTADFTWSPEPQTEGSAVAFTDASTSSPDAIATWSWDFGGQGTSALQDPSFTFDDDGTYTVTLTVTDDDGTTDSVSQTVMVLDLTPTAGFDWAPDPQEEGSAILFSDLSTSAPDPIVGWSWDFAGLGGSSDQNAAFTFDDDGDYLVTLTVTDEDGSTDTVSQTVTVLDLAPTAGFDWAPDPQDEGVAVAFTDASTSFPDDVVAWSWDFGGLGTSSDQNPSFTFDDHGIYTVTLMVEDDDGTTDTVSHTVTIVDLGPTAEFTWAPDPQDEGAAVAFTDASTSYPDDVVAWSWDFDGLGTSAVQNPSFMFIDAGTYTVTLTVTDDDGSADSVAHTVTVIDVNEMATMSIDDVARSEGYGGATTTFAFTVSLSKISDQTVTVDFETADGTAVSNGSGKDYDPTQGTLAFAPGDVSQTISVTVIDDSVSETEESFFVVLSNASNALIGDGVGEGRIQNDDEDPVLISISDFTGAEGSSGTTVFSFTVSLSGVSATPVSVKFDTSDGTAVSNGSGKDYGGSQGTLTFTGDETEQIISVSVNGDTLPELDETFFVELSSPSNAVIADGLAVGIIANDDDSPVFSIDDASLPEDDAGTTDLVFRVWLSKPSGQEITIDYDTVDNLATSKGSDADYQSTRGTLTFPKGETEQFISVSIYDDEIPEADETFFIDLSNPIDAVIGDGRGVGTIVDNEETPILISIDNVSQAEGHAGDTEFVFTVSLSEVSSNDVSVDFATTDDTATTKGKNKDYQRAHGTLTIVAGETSQTISVVINGDVLSETDETFFVELSRAINASIVDNQGVATILDDESALQTGEAPYAQLLAERLDVSQVQPFLTEAIKRWDAIGSDTVGLATADIQIASLAGPIVGRVTGNTIFIDPTASGHGWFIDASPWDDSEFETPGNQGELNRLDLLTVVMHEAGHLLGLEHTAGADDLMGAWLSPGERPTINGQANQGPLFDFLSSSAVFHQFGRLTGNVQVLSGGIGTNDHALLSVLDELDSSATDGATSEVARGWMVPDRKARNTHKVVDTRDWLFSDLDENDLIVAEQEATDVELDSLIDRLLQ